MAMTVTRVKDTRTAKVFIHKLADVRGGVSIVSNELNGNYLHEGTVISAPINGKCHIVKFAKVVESAEATATALKINKGHHFKVNDIVFVATGGAAYAITAIDNSNSSYDTITVGTTLGAVSEGAYILEAAEAGAAVGAFKYAPFAVVGTGSPINPRSNIITDAWIIGVIKGNQLPTLVANQLKGIINY